MRLIDADKVNVVEYAGLVHIPPNDYLRLCAFFKKQLIDEQPTINPEDYRPHGAWIEKVDYWTDTYYACSVCNYDWSFIDGSPNENGMHYCPHCGARMDREENDNA